jgi:hypothetical protein
VSDDPAADPPAVARVVRALGSGAPRLRGWALERLERGLARTEGPAIAPRPPYPAALRAALAALVPPLAEDETLDGPVRLFAICRDAGVAEAAPAIEALLAAGGGTGLGALGAAAGGAQALARLGVTGPRAAAAVRAALAHVQEQLGAHETGGVGDPRGEAARACLDVARAVLPSLLAIEGPAVAGEAFGVALEGLLEMQGEAEASDLGPNAGLIDAIHAAAGLRGAVHAIALALDAGLAPGPLERAVPKDALLHAKKRSTPKLVKAALHALRPLVEEGARATPGGASDSATGVGPEAASAPAAGAAPSLQPTAYTGVARDDAAPLAGALAIAREALRLRERVEALRGERARLVAVLLLAARAKLLHALPSHLDAAPHAPGPSPDAGPGAAPAPAPAAPPSPEEARERARREIERLLDPHEGHGAAIDLAQRELCALGDAALPALCEALDALLPGADPCRPDRAVAALVESVARLGTPAAAEALLARFDALVRADREALLAAAEALADPRLLDPLCAELRPGEVRLAESIALVAEVSGAAGPRVEEAREILEAAGGDVEAEGHGAASITAAIDAVLGGAPATLDLDLACAACGRTYSYPVERAFRVLDAHADLPERRRRIPGITRVLVEEERPDPVVVADELACKGCGARDGLRATADAAISVGHFLSALEEVLREANDEVDPEHCPAREGPAADLLSLEEWPSGTPFDEGTFRAKLRERLAAFRADAEDGDPDARWPPELDDAWPSG